jgi:hypothetical protein
VIAFGLSLRMCYGTFAFDSKTNSGTAGNAPFLTRIRIFPVEMITAKAKEIFWSI